MVAAFSSSCARRKAISSSGVYRLFSLSSFWIVRARDAYPVIIPLWPLSSSQYLSLTQNMHATIELASAALLAALSALSMNMHSAGVCCLARMDEAKHQSCSRTRQRPWAGASALCRQARGARRVLSVWSSASSAGDTHASTSVSLFPPSESCPCPHSPYCAISFLSRMASCRARFQ